MNKELALKNLIFDSFNVFACTKSSVEFSVEDQLKFQVGGSKGVTDDL